MRFRNLVVQSHCKGTHAIGRRDNPVDGLLRRCEIARGIGILVIHGLQFSINSRRTGILEFGLHVLERAQQFCKSLLHGGLTQIGQAEVIEDGPVTGNAHVLLHAEAQSAVSDNHLHLVAREAAVGKGRGRAVHVVGHALPIVHA